MTKKIYIEGSAITNIPNFYTEINRVFMAQVNWKLGPSLDAFNDLLYGAYGEMEGHESIVLLWKDFDKSSSALDYAATQMYYREVRNMEIPFPAGQSYMDIILEIIADHPNIKLLKL